MGPTYQCAERLVSLEMLSNRLAPRNRHDPVVIPDPHEVSLQSLLFLLAQLLSRPSPDPSRRYSSPSLGAAPAP